MNETQTEILKQLRYHTDIYPITIKDLENRLSYSNSLINRHITILVDKKLVEAKKVAGVKGGKVFYQTPGKDWSEIIQKKCKNCHCKSTIKTCIFHEELADTGVYIEPHRVRTKLGKNTVACQWFIERKTNWKRKRFEDFLRDTRRIIKSKKGFEISYHCYFCDEKLPMLGKGLLPELGSSVLRCNNCESIYKMVYKKKAKIYKVNYTEEKGVEYRNNFYKAAGIFSTVEPYTGPLYGILIPDLQLCNMNFRTKTIAIQNWVGKLNKIEYVVVWKKEDYECLLELLPSKGYKNIKIIFGGESFISPPPVPQQVGLLHLLRETKVVNIEFCLATLVSRITVLRRIAYLVDKAKLREAIGDIRLIIKELGKKSFVTAREWNALDRNAANAMWRVIVDYLESIEIYFPGRGRGRLVRDPFIPYRMYFAYSAVDTLVNGVFGKARDYVKEYCSKIGFCWDGLPGICHGKTSGGEFGLHLDMSEPIKLMVIPILIEAIVEGEVELIQVPFIHGRRRQKMFFLYPESELIGQVEKIVKRAFNSKVNSKLGRRVIESYFIDGKYWLKNFHRKSNNYQIEHHGVEYQPWAIIKEEVWKVLATDQRQQLIEQLRKYHEEIGFKPLTLEEMN